LLYVRRRCILIFKRLSNGENGPNEYLPYGKAA
jgi:hypothetical protein